MERLTKRSRNGTAIYNTPSGEPVKWENNRYKVLQKLAEYEDLEESLQNVFGKYFEILKKVVWCFAKNGEKKIKENPYALILLTDEDAGEWEEYKELKMQGRIMKLPISLNGSVYTTFDGGIYDHVVKGVLFKDDKIFAQDESGNIIGVLGETVFCTRKEAKAAFGKTGKR